MINEPSLAADDRAAAGQRGEQAAREYLLAQGLRFITANWRAHAHKQTGEIDLIMQDGAVLVFVEVRARSQSPFGSAADSIDQRKQAKLLRAAQAYLVSRYRGAPPPCRFDVVAIDAGRIQWLRDAFSA